MSWTDEWGDRRDAMGDKEEKTPASHRGGSDEHLLIGSLAYQEKQERRAEREGYQRNETNELIAILHWIRDAPDDRINSRIETETGVALHYTLVNRLEVLGAVYHLSPLERWCIVHFHWEGKSDAEIAAYYEMSEKAVRKARSRGYTKLRRMIYDRAPVAA